MGITPGPSRDKWHIHRGWDSFKGLKIATEGEKTLGLAGAGSCPVPGPADSYRDGRK